MFRFHRARQWACFLVGCWSIVAAVPSSYAQIAPRIQRTPEDQLRVDQAKRALKLRQLGRVEAPADVPVRVRPAQKFIRLGAQPGQFPLLLRFNDGPQVVVQRLQPQVPRKLGLRFSVHNGTPRLLLILSEGSSVQEDIELIKRGLVELGQKMVEDIDSACKLTAEQRVKLHLAILGDATKMERVLLEWSKMLDGEGDLDQLKLRNAVQEFRDIGSAVEDCFESEDALFTKVLLQCLTLEQNALLKGFEVAQADRSEWLVQSIRRAAVLTDEQAGKIHAILKDAMREVRFKGKKACCDSFLAIENHRLLTFMSRAEIAAARRLCNYHLSQRELL